MKIITIDSSPFDSITYARVKGQNLGVERAELPFYFISVDRLPQGLSAIIATSDLQGIEITSEEGNIAKVKERYLGHAVIEKCVSVLQKLGISSKKTGVLLAGDFHSDTSLKKRGGYGDVRDVWMAFHEQFKWVAGVAGNHDVFGSPKELKAFRQLRKLHLLNGDSVVVDGIRVSGVSGVIGKISKPWRHKERDHLALIDQASKDSPRFLLLHEGPDLPEYGLTGNSVIRKHLERCKPTTVICGHRNWPGNSVQSLNNGMKIINIEGKVIVFRKKAYSGDKCE